MNTIKNPARSRPLSRNVRRLMQMEREAPKDPSVKKVEREFAAREYAYCDMQGNIFMAAIDRGLTMAEFAPIYMNSQLAGVIDYSFSCAGGMETDSISNLLKVPLLLKSPETIVDVTMWLNEIVSKLDPEESANLAVVSACMEDERKEETEQQEETKQKDENIQPESAERETSVDTSADMSVETNIETRAQTSVETNIETLTEQYAYAYWLGYIYRFECLLHEESSRMVYGAFSEDFMRRTYEEMEEQREKDSEITLAECAGEICSRLDMLLVGKLWKTEQA